MRRACRGLPPRAAAAAAVAPPQQLVRGRRHRRDLVLLDAELPLGDRGRPPEVCRELLVDRGEARGLEVERAVFLVLRFEGARGREVSARERKRSHSIFGFRFFLPLSHRYSMPPLTSDLGNQTCGCSRDGGAAAAAAAVAAADAAAVALVDSTATPTKSMPPHHSASSPLPRCLFPASSGPPRAAAALR